MWVKLGTAWVEIDHFISCLAKVTEYNVHRMDPRAEELAVARTR